MSKRGKAHERRQAAMLAALPPPAPPSTTCYPEADFREHADVYRCLFEDLPSCGCGDVVGRFEIFHALLRWRAAWRVNQEEGEKAWESDVAPVLGIGDRADDVAMQRSPLLEILLLVLDGAGLLEHGVGIHGSFLTERGETVLGFLDLYGCDPGAWPGEPW